MATAYKILGQVATATLGATTEGTLYTSTSVEAVVSSITICNQAASSASYRIAVQPVADVGSGATSKHYVTYDATIAPNDTIALTLGITMAAGSRIRVYGSSATLSFAAFGSEIS